MLDHSSNAPALTVHAPEIDPLTDMLRGLRLSGIEYSRRELDGHWAFSFPKQADAYFHFIGNQACWLLSPSGNWLKLRAGDAVLLPHGSAHALASAPDAIPIPFPAWQSDARDIFDFRPGRNATGWRLFHGIMRFNLGSLDPVLRLMPDVIAVDGISQSGPSIMVMLDAMADEIATNQVGACTIVCRLADVIAAQIFRSWVQHGSDDVRGWIAAIRHPDIGRVLAAIHADPAREWSVSSLAKLMGASRSSFASKFASIVGDAPLHYITQVRMHRARQLMLNQMRISEVAQLLRYESEASFSRAFKRVMGMSPSSCRRGLDRR